MASSYDDSHPGFQFQFQIQVCRRRIQSIPSFHIVQHMSTENQPAGKNGRLCLETYWLNITTCNQLYDFLWECGKELGKPPPLSTKVPVRKQQTFINYLENVWNDEAVWSTLQFIILAIYPASNLIQEPVVWWSQLHHTRHFSDSWWRSGFLHCQEDLALS